MRVLVAARLSRYHDGSTGLETQDMETQRWARDSGHAVVATAADRRSGTIAPWDRPNLRPWVTDPAKIAMYDAVAAYRLDRLSRGDKASTNAIEAWAMQHGKQLLTVDGLTFPCEGADGIRWDVTARIAHEEWLKISSNWRRMQAYLRDSDRLTGRPPSLGVRIAMADDGHKVLEPDPATVPVTRELAERYLFAGASLRALCGYLDELGILTSQGGRWSPTTLAALLRNPVLTGRRKDASGRTILAFEPVLDMETWLAVQAKMDAKAHRRGVAPGDTALLTSVLFCEKCGGPMYRSRSTNTSRRSGTVVTEYYRCHGTLRQRSTCKNMALLELMDVITEAYMAARVREPYMEVQVLPGDDHRAELDAIDRELSGLLERLRAGDADGAEFAAESARLAADRDRVRVLPATGGGVREEETGETIGQHWLTLDTAGKRAYLIETGTRIEAAHHGPRRELTVHVNGHRILPGLRD
jgi:site-specific DNA recombinase